VSAFSDVFSSIFSFVSFCFVYLSVCYCRQHFTQAKNKPITEFTFIQCSYPQKCVGEETEGKTKTGTERDRQRQRNREIEKGTDRQRQTDREREKERDRDIDRERQTEKGETET
jgi:hypothetical protein